MHLLSIIVPVYNVEKYVSDCINSILNQTYRDFELILIDDGSTDSSGKICDEYSKKDSRIKVIHKNNMGCSAARNTGINFATGDLVAFADSDDLIDSDMYGILIENIDSTNSDVSACSFVEEKYNLGMSKVVRKHQNKPDPIVFVGGEIYESITRKEKSIEGYLWNKVWKRKVIGSHLFREDIVMCEDSIFSWEVLKDAKRVCYCNLPMYHYRIRETSATRNSSINKMMGALVSYELMLGDASMLSESVVINLVRQYLVWNYLIFKQLIKEKTSNYTAYERIKNNCKEKIGYLSCLGIEARVGISCIARFGYVQAKIVVSLLDGLQKIKSKLAKKNQ